MGIEETWQGINDAIADRQREANKAFDDAVGLLDATAAAAQQAYDDAKGDGKSDEEAAKDAADAEAAAADQLVFKAGQMWLGMLRASALASQAPAKLAQEIDQLP